MASCQVGGCTRPCTLSLLRCFSVGSTTLPVHAGYPPPGCEARTSCHTLPPWPHQCYYRGRQDRHPNLPLRLAAPARPQQAHHLPGAHRAPGAAASRLAGRAGRKVVAVVWRAKMLRGAPLSMRGAPARLVQARSCHAWPAPHPPLLSGAAPPALPPAAAFLSTRPFSAGTFYVDCRCGENPVTPAEWPGVLAANHVLVMTAQSLLNLLDSGHAHFDRIALLVCVLNGLRAGWVAGELGWNVCSCECRTAGCEETGCSR